MSKPNYYKYLRSPEWQVVRRLALERADGRCQVCNQPGRLDVHHRTYDRLGAELLSDVTVLCRDCHAKHHDKLPTTPAALIVVPDDEPYDGNPLPITAQEAALQHELCAKSFAAIPGWFAAYPDELTEAA